MQNGDLLLAVAVAFDAIKDMFLVAGSAYLIQFHGWSKWTMVLAILFSCNPVIWRAVAKRFEVKAGL